MRRNTLLVTGAILLVAGGAIHRPATATEPVAHAGRNVNYMKSVEVTEKDEATQRVAGTFVREGLTFHTEGPRAGQVSTIVISGTFENTGGTGTHEATILRTFADGDTVTIEIVGKKLKEDGLSRGDYRCVDGTGSLEGVACEGTYTSTPYPNRMSVVDWEGTVTQPSS
jgi:hypothetical protein